MMIAHEIHLINEIKREREREKKDLKMLEE